MASLLVLLLHLIFLFPFHVPVCVSLSPSLSYSPSTTAIYTYDSFISLELLRYTHYNASVCLLVQFLRPNTYMYIVKNLNMNFCGSAHVELNNCSITVAVLHYFITLQFKLSNAENYRSTK